MKIAVTGSIATDHLMSFPGRFADQFIADQLHKVSLSFLVDELVLRRGGVAANIAFGMAQLGLRPVLLGAVGADFDDYRSWLERHGVDCTSVHVSEVAHTARFVCTTDTEMCQIASFYAGAMSEARNIELAPVADRVGGLDLVLVSANDPDAMLRHSEECRQRGYAFAADPSQQLARMDGSTVLGLIDGADYLLTNDYEKSLLQSKAGLTDEQLLDRVKIRVTTLGKDGVEIAGREIEPIHVPIARELHVADPTGVGDGFRAGFFTGLSWGLSLERSAQIGSLLATLVLETVGTQEYEVRGDLFVKRLAESYGDEAAEEVRQHLG
ncbi:carbohydrate kinase family protein [Micromonospora sp. WMMD1102]|uniref:carbohydrate kinase family protein n=1 Tax=Micromonospora sp. WMMD1102 TaxID=3016105 RepID=UPI0024151712|nr:carbohydrate kinase family protein [Micromonospora sp. WMMD1102]MDG4788901.1 carbohydrate kinase family protein [Micromonospora sp. WMMD1102]